MAKYIKDQYKGEKVTVVIRRAKPGLKIALCALILLSVAALWALRVVHNDLQKQTDRLIEEAAQAEAQQQELEEKQENMDKVSGIQDIAREELGLVDPNTVLIDPVPAQTVPATSTGQTHSGNTGGETLP